MTQEKKYGFKSVTHDEFRVSIQYLNRSVWVFKTDNTLYIREFSGLDTEPVPLRHESGKTRIGFLGKMDFTALGSPGFCREYGLEYPYLMGSMANGISSIAMMRAAGANGMAAFFGSAGLPLKAVESAVDTVQSFPSEWTYGFNFIHSPSDPGREQALCELYIRRKIRLVEASAFMNLTLPLIRYRVAGIHKDANGNIIAPNKIIAKASRVEVARRFFSPPAEKYLRELVAQKHISEQQAEWAAQIPVATDVTAEADSGGHTDFRPAVTLLPTFLSLRDEMQQQFPADRLLRVGAAGGIGTPISAAAMFAMGADYILTGSINQACVESGATPEMRKMLAETLQAEVAPAPAADMFEIGAKVQVLKRGTLFPMRANKLADLYHRYTSLEDIPRRERVNLEKTVFRATLDEIWDQTCAFFRATDPARIQQAESDPKRKMALVFRWYLGQASKWAMTNEPTRKIDYQIWCGPAMSAFNQWVNGTFLEPPEARHVDCVARNILWGAAVSARIQSLKIQGISLDDFSWKPVPQTPEKLASFMD